MKMGRNEIGLFPTMFILFLVFSPLFQRADGAQDQVRNKLTADYIAEFLSYVAQTDVTTKYCVSPESSWIWIDMELLSRDGRKVS